MTGAVLREWAAWSPGREDRDAWRAWASAPAPLAREGSPEVKFLPALLRRRCSPLTRIVLTAAFDCCPTEERAEVRTVFASRHGNINDSIEMVEALARRQPLSPARFSHTVHNAQAGLYSIAAANRRASSSLAAQADTFGCGWIEALTHLQREPDRSVLLVMADLPLAPTFAPLVEEPVAAYALALLLSASGDGPTLDFGTAPSGSPAAEAKPWPEALEFLRWLLGSTPRLSLGAGGLRFQWERR